MDDSCPHCGPASPAFAAMNEAVLELTTDQRTLERVLTTMGHVARRLANARYAAIGVPDQDGGFEKFIPSGISAKQWDAIGEPPRQHGLLGAMLTSPEPYRTA